MFPELYYCDVAVCASVIEKRLFHQQKLEKVLRLPFNLIHIGSFITYQSM